MKQSLTILLIPLIILASLFMIMESGEYYSTTFYDGNLLKGYWSAALVEMFLVVFSALYFSGRPVLNIIVKSLMTGLFLVMISGASLKIINPLLTELSTTNHNTRLVDYLLSENDQSKTSLKLLKGQRTNTALQAKFQRELSRDIRSALKKENRSGWMIWISILFTTFLRFAVQSANLVLVHVLGFLWRDNFKSKPKFKPVKRDSKGRFVKNN